MEQGEKKNIMVIDRSALSRNIYKIILGKYPVFSLYFVELPNPTGSVLGKDFFYHTVIFNINSAGHDIEATQEMLAFNDPYNRLPKIVICQRALIPTWKMWCEDNMAVIIEKPFHPDELVLELKRILNIKF